MAVMAGSTAEAVVRSAAKRGVAGQIASAGTDGAAHERAFERVIRRGADGSPGKAASDGTFLGRLQAPGQRAGEEKDRKGGFDTHDVLPPKSVIDRAESIEFAAAAK